MAPLLFLLLQGAEPAPAAVREGLWMGPFRLCRDNVQRVRRVRDISGEPALLIELAPGMQPRFGEETARLVGLPMEIRLDGRLLSAPVINERITGFQAQISGPQAGLLRKAAKAAKKGC